MEKAPELQELASKRRKISFLWLVFVLSCSSAWQSRCKTQHAAFGDADYSTRSGVVRDSLVLLLMTG